MDFTHPCTARNLSIKRFAKSVAFAAQMWYDEYTEKIFEVKEYEKMGFNRTFSDFGFVHGRV